MDNKENNINQIQQQDIYSMFNKLREKYEILEKKQKENEEKIERNKNNILLFNKNLKTFKNSYQDFKKECEKEINDLKEIFYKQNKANKSEKMDNINIEQINKIKNEMSEKNNILEKKFEELKISLNEMKLKLVNNELLKIDEKEENTVFEKFENLLGKIIEQNEINMTNLVKLREVTEKLNENNINVNERVNNYFSELYKYEKNNDNLNKIGAIHAQLQEKINDINIELMKNNKININNSKNTDKKNDKKSDKKSDKKIDQFRTKYNITEEYATDEDIKKYLKHYNNDEQKVYSKIMNKFASK